MRFPISIGTTSNSFENHSHNWQKYILLFRSTSLLVSSTTLKGVIFGVPVSDYEEDILEALVDQNVVSVKRLPFKGQPDVPSETILLSFKLVAVLPC